MRLAWLCASYQLGATGSRRRIWNIFPSQVAPSYQLVQSFSTAPIRRAFAAPEIKLEDDSDQRPARAARVVPASASYFTTQPNFTDRLLSLQSLLRKYQTLPTIETDQARRVTWKTLSQFRLQDGEPVKAARYHKVTELLHRLNRIHPSLMPQEVHHEMEGYKRTSNPHTNVARPRSIDQYGRSNALGRRKAATARVWLVEGEGEVLVNGKSLMGKFDRMHDRESAIWALKATGRLDKYNVWALVHGGGTTGQAEALTLGVARALLVHEPMLKPVLRRGKPLE